MILLLEFGSSGFFRLEFILFHRKGFLELTCLGLTGREALGFFDQVGLGSIEVSGHLGELGLELGGTFLEAFDQFLLLLKLPSDLFLLLL